MKHLVKLDILNAYYIPTSHPKRDTSKKKIENTWVKIYGAIYWLLGFKKKWISWKISTLYSNN
jgi:hypothetical protein